MENKAKRYNQGKIRHELISPIAMAELAKVYTLGAHKYSVYEDKEGNKILGKDIPFEEAGNYKMIEDAADNWKKGQDWKSAMGSVKRHIAAWERGEDIDELGTFHLGNAMWGLATLLHFYKTFPQGDNRDLPHNRHVKIGLDIDEVICNWVGPWCEKHGYNTPQSWNFSYDNKTHFENLQSSGEIEKFYTNLPRKIDPSEIPFEPHCYVTARSVDEKLTKSWLLNNGFPAAPVYSVGFGESKVEAIQQSGIDVFVDDSYCNYLEIRNAGIVCFLYDAPHNQRYNVGYYKVSYYLLGHCHNCPTWYSIL